MADGDAQCDFFLHSMVISMPCTFFATHGTHGESNIAVRMYEAGSTTYGKDPSMMTIAGIISQHRAGSHERAFVMSPCRVAIVHLIECYIGSGFNGDE